MLQPIYNHVQVPAYEPTGEQHIIETTRYGLVTKRVISNTLFPKMFGDEPLIEVHYPDFDVEISPVVVKGETYYPWWCYGSAIKKGSVFATKRDLMAEVARTAQDSYRFGRWSLPNGQFGAGWGKIKILAVKPGTVYPDIGPVEDGFAYLDKGMVNAFGRFGAIKLGRNRGSYQYWQRLNMDVDLWNELWPAQLKRLEKGFTISTLLDASGDKLRQDLVALDPEMITHPLVAFRLRASASEHIARIISTFGENNENGYMFVAVPTVCDHVATRTPGVIARYPIDDFSLYTVMPEGDEDELERIASLEVVEYSVSNLSYHDKGHAGLIDGLKAKTGYDMITCTENIKFGSPDDQEYGLAILQRWAKGSALGVNAEWGHRFGLDHDDLVVKVDVDPSSAYWAAVKAQESRSTGSFKIQKTKEPRNEESCKGALKRLLNMNLVGVASSVQSRVCSLSYAEQERVFELKGMDWEEVHTLLNHGVKVGTDCFKSASPDPRGVMKTMFQLQNGLASFVHGGGYSNWDVETFTHSIPEIITDFRQDAITKADGRKVKVTYVTSENNPDWHILEKDELKNAIWPEQDGLVANLCREGLRILRETDLTSTCEVAPLTKFIGWVKKPSLAMIDKAIALRKQWSEIISHTPVSDGVAVEQAKAQFAQICRNAAGGNEQEMAEALWFASHSARNEEATGMAVFAGFPDECERIIKDKPGLQNGFNTILVGVQYQCPGLESVELPVEVVKFKTTKNGRETLRFAVVGTVDGQKQPLDMSYPKNMIGLIPQNGAVPNLGTYNASIRKASDNSWSIYLA